MFQDFNGDQVAFYTFHDPPQSGVHRMRSTTSAILLNTGELFIGCSCASEGDQFTKARGRELSVAEATEKYKKWRRGSTKVRPDFMVDTTPAEGSLAVNRAVHKACLTFQIEKFRLILADRYAIIQGLNISLCEIMESMAT